MKSKTTIVIWLFTCVYAPLMLAQTALVVSGGNTADSGGTSSYSIGQIVYTEVGSDSGVVNQGVQNPFEISTLGTDEYPGITLQMYVYPNPTTSSVYLKFENDNFQDMHYYLYDLKGSVLSHQDILETTSQIDMQHLAPSIYLLDVRDQQKVLKSFKIIKNN